MANEHENRDQFEDALLEHMGVRGDLQEAGSDWNRVAKAFSTLKDNANAAMSSVKSGNEADLLVVSSTILSNMAVAITALAKKDPALRKAVDSLGKAASVIMQSHPGVER